MPRHKLPSTFPVEAIETLTDGTVVLTSPEGRTLRVQRISTNYSRVVYDTTQRPPVHPALVHRVRVNEIAPNTSLAF